MGLLFLIPIHTGTHRAQTEQRRYMSFDTSLAIKALDYHQADCVGGAKSIRMQSG